MNNPTEPKLNWNIKAGIHTGTLESIHSKSRRHKGETIAQVRFLFRIDALSDEHTTAMVGKSFDLDYSDDGELGMFLAGWVGERWLNGPGHEWIVFFDELRGKQADLVIKHKKSKKFPKPFVNIISAHP